MASPTIRDRLVAQVLDLPPLDALYVIRRLVEHATVLMATSRDAGATLQQIGEAAGTSRQAVWNRLNEQGQAS